MVQTGGGDNNRGARGEFSYNAERKEDEMSAFFGIVVSKGRKSAYATRKVAVVKVIQGDCFRSKIKAYSGENAISEIVLQRGVMVEQFSKNAGIKFVHFGYECCERT